eukprot:s1605_g7.t1
MFGPGVGSLGYDEDEFPASQGSMSRGWGTDAPSAAVQVAPSPKENSEEKHQVVLGSLTAEEKKAIDKLARGPAGTPEPPKLAAKPSELKIVPKAKKSAAPKAPPNNDCQQVLKKPASKVARGKRLPLKRPAAQCDSPEHAVKKPASKADCDVPEHVAKSPLSEADRDTPEADREPLEPAWPTRATFAGRRCPPGGPAAAKWQSNRKSFYSNVSQEFWKDDLERKFWRLTMTMGPLEAVAQFLHEHPTTSKETTASRGYHTGLQASQALQASDAESSALPNATDVELLEKERKENDEKLTEL